MAKPIILLIIMIVVMATTSNAECESEVYGMSRWQCVMWIAGVEFEPYASQESCCEQINSLSPNCRCHALSQILLDIPAYQHQVCALVHKCRLSACAACAASI